MKTQSILESSINDHEDLGELGAPTSKRNLGSCLPALALFITGLILVFHVSIFSGFRLAQTGPSDPRLNNYILERNHQWFAGERDEGFWDPPFFHPWKGVGAHTESLIGAQPFYSLWRVIGLPPGVSYQLCAMGLLGACYLTMWLLLRKGFSLGPLSAAAGAFLFAFSSPRSHQIAHIQLFAHFAMPLAVLGLVREFRDGRNEPRRWRWVALFAGAMAIQLYSCVYLTWFSCLMLVCAAAMALIWPRARSTLLASLCCKPLTWFAACLGAMVIGMPLLLRYLSAADRTSGTSYEGVLLGLPQWPALFFQGTGNWIGQLTGINEWSPVAQLPVPGGQAMGFGLVTTAVILVGLWTRRRDPVVIFLSLVSVMTLVLVFRFPGDFSFWKWGYEILPGSSAFRALARVVLPLHLVAAVGLAFAVDRMRKIAAPAVIAVLLMVVALEQGQTQPAFDWRQYDSKARAIAAAIPAQCDAFFYSLIADSRPRDRTVTQVDGMWAGLHAGVPTVNGYSGFAPPGWWETVKRARMLKPLPKARIMMQRGLTDAGAPDETVCWIRLEMEDDTILSSETVLVPIGDSSCDGDDGAANKGSGNGWVLVDVFESSDTLRWSSTAEIRNEFPKPCPRDVARAVRLRGY